MTRKTKPISPESADTADTVDTADTADAVGGAPRKKQPRRKRTRRTVLLVLLSLVVLALIAIAAIVVPILTHHSAGASGQQIPDDYAASSTATGADQRTRTIKVTTEQGEPAKLQELQPGEKLVVRGSGYDAGIGIYVSFCAIPAEPTVKPGPCLGGIPEGATAGEAKQAESIASAWVSDDWAWRAFATHQFTDHKKGKFAVTLTVPEPVSEGLDCRTARCAVVTRADHTATADRIQDMLLPVKYR